MKRNIDKIEKVKEEICIKILYWSFLSQLLFSVSKRIMPTSTFSIAVCTIISFSPLVFLFARLLFLKQFKFDGKFILAVIIVTGLYLLSVASGTPLDTLLLYYPLTLYGLILLFITLYIKDYKRLYDYFIDHSYILSIISIMIIFVDKAVYAYNMHFSYIVLIALCFHTLNLFYNKKKIDIIFVLLDIVLILAFGSRGPMLCYVLFIMMFVFFGKQRRTIKVLVGVFASLISIYFSRIMSKIEELMQLLNIHSRTISLLVTNPQYVSGRDVITQNTFSLISQSPIVGYGLAGEYKYLKEYPHNLILDVVVNWGIIIGGLFLCALFYIVIMGLLCSKDKIRLLLIVFVAYGLVALLFSGTYISWDGFYILIGLSLGAMRNKREGA